MEGMQISECAPAKLRRVDLRSRRELSTPRSLFSFARQTAIGLVCALVISNTTLVYGQFVTVDTVNARFMLSGQPFYFAATNNYWLMQQRSYNSTCVDDAFDAAQAVGIKVIRTWGFADGWAWTSPTDAAILQESPGVYRENAFSAMDYVIKEAGLHGLKLIIALVNNWDDFGGMNQYVAWAGKSGHDLFYTDTTVKSLYKNYVNDFVNRTNTYTAVKYKDDPTIMAWELANEARANSDPGATGDIIKNWYQEMAQYLKSADPNHLVSTGEEGFDIDQVGYSSGYENTWVFGGATGTSFKANTTIPEIDFGGVHLYPSYWGFSATPSGNNWIIDHTILARNEGKPLIVGEYGYTDRSFYQDWLSTVYDEDASGAFLWELNPACRGGGIFGITYPTDAALVTMLVNHADSMNSKGGIPPQSDTTPPTVSISHSPVTPSSTQIVTFTATATDASGISEIRIYVGGIVVQTCVFSETCSYTGGPYADGSTHTYYATAKDNSPNFNEGSDPTAGTRSFTVGSPVPSDKWISASYAGWRQAYLPPDQIDYDAVTHIRHAFIVPNIDGTLNTNVNGFQDPTTIPDAVSAAHSAGAKIVISIGGGNTRYLFEGAMSDAYRATFVSNIVDFITNNGYDGVDIDMEDMRPENKADYQSFITELQTALDIQDPNLLLTCAVAWEFPIIAGVQDKFDQINIMTYGMSRPYQDWAVWHNSPIFHGGATFPPAGGGGALPSIDEEVDKLVAEGVPLTKIGIGIEFYGFVWEGGNNMTNGGATQPRDVWGNNQENAPTVREHVPFYEIMDTYYQLQYYQWDTNGEAAYLSVDNAGSVNDKFISYDDETTCLKKIEYIEAKGLGGAMIWELAGGWRPSESTPDPLLQAIKNAILGPTEVPADKEQKPLQYHLAQNYPNPFNPRTIITFSLPRSGFVRLTVYSVLGQKVGTLVNAEKDPGTYQVSFDALSPSGGRSRYSPLASGVYFYLLQAGDFVETKKLILLR